MYIWGAGMLGKEAIKYYEDITAFIDNDIRKQDSGFCGKKVISFADYLKMDVKEHIVICAAWENVIGMQKQLKEYGINDYSVFNLQLFENIDLMCNQYEVFEGVSESAWNEKKDFADNKKTVREYVNKYKDLVPWPHEIEIETINRCNGVCSFCPVNVNKDNRIEEYMEEDLFFKIVKDLHNLDYSGRVALFSNNEPFLDPRIIKFSKILKEQLPHAQIHLFTNGTLMTLDLFKQIVEYVDELVIDNYNQQLQLIPNVRIIKEYIETLKDVKLRKKVKILLRKPNEFLSSRGGDAPNRTKYMDVSSETCALPFCQMVIRPSGKVSLCCNDSYGRETLGDLRYDSILDVWYGEKYQVVRSDLIKGRGYFEHCKNCDTFMII